MPTGPTSLPAKKLFKWANFVNYCDGITSIADYNSRWVGVVIVVVVGVGNANFKKYPLHPCLVVELTDDRISWVGLKRFHCDL